MWYTVHSVVHVVQCGTVWCSVVQCGAVWHSVVHVVQCGIVKRPSKDTAHSTARAAEHCREEHFTQPPFPQAHQQWS